MKVAQHEVLGNDSKRDVRPARDDRKVWRLLFTSVAGVDRPLRDGSLFLELTQHFILGYFHLVLWDQSSSYTWILNSSFLRRL
jgi:hypothetical protein